tara:strand:- start:209 stop:580 length:372 start_codon:yes stop_codon:yes gene_type:complete
MEGLIILYGLLVKHAIADLAIQSLRKTPGDKSDLKSLKGYIHAGDHAGLTFVVIALLTNNFLMSISIALLDYVLHFIIDYVKTRIIKRYKWTTDQKAYWITQAIDQTLHYTCYLSYVLILTSI